MSLIQELKRRNVFKVAVAYVVVSWLVAQVLQLIFESFGSPDWVMKTVLVLMGMGLLYLTQGRYQSALDEFSKESFEFLKLTGQAISYHHLQQKDEAVAALQTLISTAGESSSYQISQVYAQWGDADNAMSWIEPGYNIRDSGLQYINLSSLFDPINEDPRFQAFLQKMNF